MPKFDQDAFNRFVLDHHVVGFFEKAITLKSGRTSNWYVNWRSAASDAFLLDQLGDFVVDFIETRGLDVDCIYGVPEGATKIGVVATLKRARRSPKFAVGSHAVPMGRAKPKEHGDPKDHFFVGEPRGKTLVLEDVTTTGGSLLSAVENLLAANINIVAAVGLTNRMERRDDGWSVKEAMEKKLGGRVPYLAMSDALQLLPLAASRQPPSEKILAAIEEEFKTYGVSPIRWEQ